MAYLNRGAGRFTNVSGAIGFDDPADTRALGLTDWDRDGDVDLWMINRTAARVQFLENLSNDAANSVTLQLQGVATNRDAIGARVTLKLSSDNGVKSVAKSLRAGDGYLSQTSKAMHFGLPSGSLIQSAHVRWPDGTSETFSNVVPGRILRLVQGEDKARPRKESSVTLAERAPINLPAGRSSRRLIPHGKLPLPPLSFATQDNSSGSVRSTPSPTLIALWADWCSSCQQEIAQFNKSADIFAQNNLQVVLVNIDAKWPASLPAIDPRFKVALAGEKFLDAIDVVQRVLPARERELTLPSSFLVDGKNRLLAFYRGAVSAKQVIADLQLGKESTETFRNRSVPIAGRWLMQSMPVDLLAMPNKLLEGGMPDLAFDYLEQHITGTHPPTAPQELPSVALTMSQVADSYLDVAHSLANGGQPDPASKAYVRALHYRPQDLGAMNSLAWLLATTPDVKVRAPTEAEKWATQVTAAMSLPAPEPLDTLAAALAAQGRFEEAIKVIDQALTLAKDSNHAGLIQVMESRKALYLNNQAFISKR